MTNKQHICLLLLRKYKIVEGGQRAEDAADEALGGQRRGPFQCIIVVNLEFLPI